MQKLNFGGCVKRKEIKQVVEDYLQYKTVVEPTKVRRYFQDCGIGGEIHSSTIVSTVHTYWDRKVAREKAYLINIDEHYVDPGSIDYVYSYKISKVRL